MRNLTRGIGFFALALWLSSVTIFDPGKVTENVLRKLVGRTEVEVVEATPGKLSRGELEVIKEELKAVGEDDVRRTLEDLTSWGSRAVGYPGNRKACEYIRKRFEEIGLEDVTVEEFQVTVPVDEGAELEVLSTGEKVPLYCLWPNEVRTPTLPKEGITGELIYGGKGEFRDFNGKQVEGSIVLMDFGCGLNYINARMLGAKAVIFFDGGVVDRKQAEDKFLRVPVDIPRFWAEDGRRLLELARSGGCTVRLRARMEWKKVRTWNVYGYLPGSDDDLIVLEAYYDAISVVPRLAVGADQACGITALLEVAEVLSRMRPRHPVLFLATSAHFQGLSGISHFLHRHSRESGYFRRRIPEDRRIDFRLFVGLDLSSHDGRTAAFSQGTFFYPTWATDHFVKNTLAPYALKFKSYSDALFPSEPGRYINAITPPKRTWKDFMSAPLGLDSEMVVFVGKHGITLATPYDIRERVDTPLDRLEYVDISNLTKQIRTIAGLISCAALDPGFFPEIKMVIRDEAHDLKGHIYWWDPKKSFTPNVPVPGAIVTYQLPEMKTNCGVRRLMVTMADEKGEFKFENIRQRRGSIEVRAYKLDDEGRITFAPDMGREGNEMYPINVRNDWWELEMMEVLFRCEALSIFDLVDPRYLSALDVLSVLTPDNATPVKYGYTFLPQNASQSQKERDIVVAAVIFGEPGSRLKVLMGTSLFGIKYLLTNAPEDLLTNPISPKDASPEVLERALGEGYKVSEGIVTCPAYKVAKDMWVVDDVRLKTLAKYAVKNERIQELHERARRALLRAKEYKDKLQYDKFVASAREAWGLEARGYPDVKATANDTVRGVVFYFALLLPFSFFLERLLFGSTKITRQVGATATIFVGVFFVLQFVHPAFSLSRSPYVIFQGFVILAMGMVVLALVVSKFNQEMRKMRRTGSGVYEADVGRVSATVAAINLGINNLRRRPLRAGLTATTLILLTFTVLSFTSVRTFIKFYKLSRPNEPPYQGALIRDRNWRGLQNSVLEYTRSAFEGEAVVSPRSWYMAKTIGDKLFLDFYVPSTGKGSFANGVVGFTPQETEITGLDSLLVAGRWFREGERKVCILPTEMAELVGIRKEEVGKVKIRALGSEFTVIGLIDSKKLNLFKDMDGEKVTPVNTVTEQSRLQKALKENPALQARAPIQAFLHLEAGNVILMPYQYVMDIGGTLRSIAIGRFKREDFIPYIEEFMTRVALTMFVGKGDKVVVYSSLGATSLSGVRNLLVPVLIAALIVLNTMLGAIHERQREIGIYSSVGLAPSHIAALFLAEAVVYATLGAVGGYLVGQVVAKILFLKGWLAGVSLNYSSLSAVWSTVVVMATVLLSTVYPAKKASAMAVPDVTRRWVLPEPEGDEWRFDFPFTIAGTEVVGMYMYLARLFDSYGEGSIGEFTTQDVRLSAVEHPEGKGYKISLMTWLAPYDLGVSQEVVFHAIPTGKHDIYRIEVHIHRVSGELSSWKRLNRGFLGSLRKHFLVWRTLVPEEKARYIEEGRAVLAGERG